ncbi:hypothetical protein SAMN05216464_11475 [Mucilaginibacter pineti]|uniref:Uncharacterized protein n=1 Tax=Mucilaginibacter pineti TaxID=1391627 RepID=A0A1G7J727_9SPHI|nr:hypothetical protein SAMN05216464_11475 [Mucilaginibacter pineti]
MKTTHPDIAALVILLYASRIEGVVRFSLFSEQNNLLNPLSAAGEERVGQRSAAGVSQIATTHKPILK